MPRPRLTKAERSELGRLLQSLRKHPEKAGRHPNPKPCPKCGEPYSGRAWRAHVPRCEGQPAAAPAIAPTAKTKPARHPGGRPPVLRPCPRCGLAFSAVEMRTHTPRCPKRRG